MHLLIANGRYFQIQRFQSSHVAVPGPRVRPRHHSTTKIDSRVHPRRHSATKIDFRPTQCQPDHQHHGHKRSDQRAGSRTPDSSLDKRIDAIRRPPDRQPHSHPFRHWHIQPNWSCYFAQPLWTRQIESNVSEEIPIQNQDVSWGRHLGKVKCAQFNPNMCLTSSQELLCYRVVHREPQRDGRRVQSILGRGPRGRRQTGRKPY